MAKKNRPGVPGNPNSNAPYDNSLPIQRSRVLKCLEKEKKVSTLQLRSRGIMHPAGRIMELRQRGYRINLHWICEPDANGVIHRVGQYIFHGLKYSHMPEV